MTANNPLFAWRLANLWAGVVFRMLHTWVSIRSHTAAWAASWEIAGAFDRREWMTRCAVHTAIGAVVLGLLVTVFFAGS